MSILGRAALFLALVAAIYVVVVALGSRRPGRRAWEQSAERGVYAVFAFTSLGTLVAVLAQPRLARRFGQITSVVIVQAASIPFLAVLGFSPILWSVILAMAVRSSLMNAGNPIFTAFAMERVSDVERATLSAAMSVLWQIGWVIGGTWYSLLQAVLGFDAGYAVNFVTIISLYSIATGLYWVWFREVDRHRAASPT